MTSPTVTSLPDGSALLEVLVQPRASREGVAGLVDGRLKIRLTAPPVDGEANAALVAFLARQLDLPRSAVEIIRGQTGRRKTVRVSGAKPGALAALTADTTSSRPAMVLALLLGAALLGGAACSGASADTTVTLSVLTPDGTDPFEGAKKVTLVVDADPRETFDLEVKDEDGYTTFSTDFSLEQATDMKEREGPISLLVYDGDDRLIARGRTPVVPLGGQEEPVVIWVNRIGASSEVPERTGASGTLANARVDATAAPLDPVGPLIIGGRDSAGDVSLAGEVYNAYYHRVEAQMLPLETARAIPAAAFVESDGRLLVAGGEGGDADDPAPFFNPEILTPIAATGGADFKGASRSTELDEALLERSLTGFAASAEGELFLVGGNDAKDAPVLEVLRVTALATDEENPGARVTVDSPASLATARQRPAVVVLDSANKLLVLGGAEDPKAPWGERLDLGGEPPEMLSGDEGLPQTGVVATRLDNSLVAAAGWLDADGQPSTQVALVNRTTVTVSDGVLSVARSAPTLTAFKVGDELRLLVAGGFDVDGNPLDTADVLRVREDRLEPVGEPVRLTRARGGHVASFLPTGDILLAGGITEGGQPTDAIELYTPCIEDDDDEAGCGDR